MTNVTGLLQEESEYMRTRVHSGFNLLMSPEQKNAKWMKDNKQKFAKPENLVVDACVRRLSVAKACMSFLEHKRAME